MLGNPACPYEGPREYSAYRVKVLRYLKNLEQLDGKQVTTQERKEAAKPPPAEAKKPSAQPQKPVPAAHTRRPYNIENLTSEELLSRRSHFGHAPSDKDRAPMADAFVIMGKPAGNGGDGTPTVLFHLPADQSVIDKLSLFCFPNGTVPPPQNGAPPPSFVFLLFDEMKTTRYSVCVYKHWTNPTTKAADTLCFCFISRMPVMSFHLDFLRVISECKDVTSLVGNPSLVPEKGSQLDILLTSVHSYTSMHHALTADTITLTSLPLLFRAPFPLKKLTEKEELERYCHDIVSTYRELGARTFVQVLKALLTEMKIVVVCADLRKLTMMVLSLLPLLGPFTFQNHVLPVLPSFLRGYLEAPCPYVFGLVDLSDSAVQQYCGADEELVVVNLDNRTLHTTASMPSTFPSEQFITNKIDQLLGKPRSSAEPSDVVYRKLVLLLSSYFEDMFSRFRKFCVRDEGRGVSIFERTAFVENCDADQVPFFRRVCDTQTFKAFEAEMLIELDEDKAK
eukprot:TRINITY_DN4573_c0_g1_i2.p1 TRINITY_DN4573_c0_g1~~TRINITY_DN4573_c0_g1_i2.p1  ORF type:complete len:508 (+),score=118.28 TRINITY_DN4573_c0_g1_i2:274-1797(+)